MWGYQLHDLPVLQTLIQPSETSSSNYPRLWWRSRETRVRNGRLSFADEPYLANRVLLHAVNVRHGTDGFTSPPKEGVLRILNPSSSAGFEPATLGPVARTLTTTPPRATRTKVYTHRFIRTYTHAHTYTQIDTYEHSSAWPQYRGSIWL
jgi:hypothetical protein